jgi:hypothetical protein
LINEKRRKGMIESHRKPPETIEKIITGYTKESISISQLSKKLIY